MHIYIANLIYLTAVEHNAFDY